MDFCGQINTEEFDFFLSAWKSHGINSGAPAPLINEQAKTIIPSLSFVTENRVVELLKEAGFVQVTQFYKAFMYCGWVAAKA